jgi:hypothetical protein
VRKPRPNILVLTSWSSDEPLLRSYVLPYLGMIRRELPADAAMFLLTWEKPGAQCSPLSAEFRSELNERGIAWVSVPYRKFGIAALALHARTIIRLRWLMFRHRIGALHAFAPPAGALGLALKRLSGARLVVDSWEPHAEPMAETHTWKRSSLSFRIMWNVERQLVRHADALLAASKAMPAYAKEKLGEVHGHVAYRPACVNTDLFDPARFDRVALRFRQGIGENDVVGICVSKLGGLYYGEEIFSLFRAAEEYFGDRFRLLLLSANPEEEVRAWVMRSGMNPAGVMHRHVSHPEVPEWLAMADFAVNPQIPVPSKRYGTPVKDGEYWAMGLPVVLFPGVSEDSEIAERERAGAICRSFGEADMRQTWEQVGRLLAEYPASAQRIRAVAIKYRSMRLAEKAYREIYSGLRGPNVPG